ncbi:MAG: endonuclease/exonuclease/phosphatase family protein, partial [Deltaproteobacteria bacterium]|nr:endonuclease/exonuclease/phosphatase family protein [Deltaproteobacteria bacterium]
MRFRLVTLNFWGVSEPLAGRLELAAEELIEHAPDAVCLQEVRPVDGRQGKTSAEVLAHRLGDYHVAYETSLRWDDDDFFPGHPGGEEGLAIVSRFPILEQRCLKLPEARKTEARILLSAQLETPAGPTWVHTTHLHWRLSDGIAREKQVLAIDEAIQGIQSERPQLLCGDFNAEPDADEIRFMRGLATLDGRRTHYQDAWLRVNPTELGWTWAMSNANTGPLRRIDINRRIDYIFVTTRQKGGAGTVYDCRLAFTGTDEQGSYCASDHYGLIADVEL